MYNGPSRGSGSGERRMLEIALYQPEIPPNTGNIARHCVGMLARLHLIGPLTIDVSRRAVRRAGLDYWPDLDFQVHETPEAFIEWLGAREPWLVTGRGELRFDRADYGPDDVLLFGNETSGVPDAWHERWPKRRIYIPVPGPIRCYNLANSVSVVMTQAALKAGLFESL